MISVTCDATFEGRPLSVLNDLLKERQRILGESAKDAVIATGINVLMSLRALTKTAPKRIPKDDVRFGESDPKYITGTKGKTKGQLFRRILVKRWKNGRQEQRVKWQRVEGVAKNRRASAKELTAAWQKWGTIRNRGLAKWALGLAMNKISTRNRVVPPEGRLAGMAAKNVDVSTREVSNGLELSIHDTLNYATLALNGGPSAVEFALKKAANKTAGRLSKVAEAKLGEKIPTPFPEVRQRRVV